MKLEWILATFIMLEIAHIEGKYGKLTGKYSKFKC
jgi:hypothetical protein